MELSKIHLKFKSLKISFAHNFYARFWNFEYITMTS